MADIEVIKERMTAPVIVKPAVNIALLIEAHKATEELIAKVFEDDVHCGAIPGTYREGQKNKAKKVLLKPGSDLLIRAGNLRAVYEVVSEELDHDRRVPWIKKRWDDKQRRYYVNEGESFGFYRFVIKCKIMTMADELVAEAIASCSTMESKYIDRPRDCENTVLKMAQKRAKASAVIEAYGLSNSFTPDLEDAEDPKNETRAGKETKGEGYNPDDEKSVQWLQKLINSRKIEMGDGEFKLFSKDMRGKQAKDIEKALEGF